VGVLGGEVLIGWRRWLEGAAVASPARGKAKRKPC
jgi:hypothetical protein